MSRWSSSLMREADEKANFCIFLLSHISQASWRLYNFFASTRLSSRRSSIFKKIVFCSSAQWWYKIIISFVLVTMRQLRNQLWNSKTSQQLPLSWKFFFLSYHRHLPLSKFNSSSPPKIASFKTTKKKATVHSNSPPFIEHQIVRNKLAKRRRMSAKCEGTGGAARFDADRIRPICILFKLRLLCLE